ncbi:serine/threonine-protein kinase SBK2 [Ornithorhynchus anatinus]|uniref:SH3 domain binding kinase family member 2 n=1 Tax=Ornithorhynchus anatinus TaxID=9258 RepID=K7EGN0_ORNAN|nr:serine/threonine-protein kinase SBK2 [Ornithorhynchus anatinus]XP_028928891.1 serine/threonine-protein kinase SBK2 [Ornithorhynchus anatinus]
MPGKQGEGDPGEGDLGLGDLTPEELSEGQAAALVLEEMLALTSQSLVRTEIGELYHEVRQLGQGRFGRVLLVSHRRRGSLMALKLLPKDLTPRHSFLYEFCVGLALGSHPGIVTNFGIGLESRDCYGFLTEAAPLRDLIAFIQPKAGLPEPAAQRCAEQLAAALEHIHSRGLVYRDLKPENVLVFDPECQRVKLADFGHTRPRGTLLRLAGGPIPYTAPELCAPPPRPEGLPIQPSLDAWALGVVLFCLLTGYFPWERPLPDDPSYDDFVAWQASGLPRDRPPPWAGLAPPATQLLKGLLALSPRERRSVGSIRGYLGKAWREPVRGGDGEGGRGEEENDAQ